MAEEKTDLAAMRHSLAHIMAAAITKLYPGAAFGVGPATDDGFYYDVDIKDKQLTEADLPVIEQTMKQIIEANQPFERIEKPIDEAIDWAKSNQQPYKEELLNDLKRAGTTVAKDLNPAELGTIAGDSAKVESVSFYKNGDFIDLCKGPHVGSTAEVGVFKLTHLAGAYWRGDDKKPQLQRLYGVAFNSESELAEYLNRQAEARARDHRKLAQELDLYVMSELVGAGLPLFTPRGTVIRDELLKFSEELQLKAGFEKVFIPHITKKELYERSGHWDKFGKELFLVKSQETADQFVLKPMNCPHHIQIYDARPRSYRELPIRYMESTVQYRDEKKGELIGLSRVRSISIDDAHIFCRLNDIEAEFTAIMDMIRQMYSVLGMSFRARLSFRDDSPQYLGNIETWQRAQQIIEDVAKKLQLEYFIAPGEAAFYGPKIDVLVTDALGREWQCATEQLDFVLPERFQLSYTDEDGTEKQPVMIHKALLGSVERFLSVYIEHTAGRLPVWLSPEQIRLITVNQAAETVKLANTVQQQGKEMGLRITLDDSNETVSKKIRSAEVQKVPYVVVIGDKEISSGEVSPRIRQDMAVMDGPKSLGVEQFLKTVSHEAKSRVIKTSI